MWCKARNWTLLVAGEAALILGMWYWLLLPYRAAPVVVRLFG